MKEIWKEIWKDIEGYEGLYQVSNLGRVKSVERKRIDKNNYIVKERIRKTGLYNGYVRIGLLKNHEYKYFSMHRLVAKTFIPNPENKPQVNHIDGNKQNNIVNNLEWVTASENAKHAVNKGLKKSSEKHKRQCAMNGKKSSKEVIQLDLDDNIIKVWSSIAEVSRKLNIAGGNISKCCKGKFKTMGGYKWKYKNL